VCGLIASKATIKKLSFFERYYFSIAAL